MPSPLVAIGVPTTHSGRFSEFWACLAKLCSFMGDKADTLPAYGSDNIRGLNTLVENFLGTPAQYLWILNDDHKFKPTLLADLLASNGTWDAVVPLVLQRAQPWWPVIYKGGADGYKQIGPAHLAHYEPNKVYLLSPYVVGGAGILVRRRVFEMMSAPWFEGGKTTHSDRGGSDLYFCQKMWELDMAIYLNTGCVMAHQFVGAVWPQYDPEQKRWMPLVEVPSVVLEKGARHEVASAAPSPAKGHEKGQKTPAGLPSGTGDS